ncbi:MAG: HD family hydrolase [Sulfolobus sp.]|nr:HD family hydrolase [Sulfolobus sp.]
MNLEKLILASKNLARTGWMQNGIPPSMAETVALHSFEASVLAYMISLELRKKGYSINPDHAAVVALFHDAGESLLGDLPKWTSDKINKTNAEKDAINELGVPVELFEEYENTKTPEGIVAKFSDRFSTYLQAMRYKKLGFSVDSIIKSYEEEINNALNTLPLSLVRDFVINLLNSV